MPRVPDDVQQCVFYLYPDRPRAEAGEPMGGTGFLTAIPNPNTAGFSFHYGVTNRHLIDDGFTVIRLNRKDGSFAIIEPTERDWIVSPNDDDVAVVPIAFGSSIGEYAIRAIPRSMYLTQDLVREHEIGPGDETYTVGRFVSHEGTAKNLSTARFGNIAQMPWEPVSHRWGLKEAKQESFLVESRSIPGYSGSPVILHIPAWSNRPSKPQLTTEEMGPWLLGIDWAHLNDFMPARDQNNNELPFRVQTNSGMAAVVPAWCIAALLDDPSVKGARDKWLAEQEAKLGKPSVTKTGARDRAKPAVATTSDASASSQPDEPGHRERFNRLKALAVKPPKSSG